VSVEKGGEEEEEEEHNDNDEDNDSNPPSLNLFPFFPSITSNSTKNTSL
jgi:hypothetical protein